MENKESINQNELSLIDLWHLLVSNLVFIISMTMVFFVSAIIYAWFFATPDYISKADVMIQVEQDASSNSSDSNFDLVNAFRLIDTVAELMEKEIILDNAINSLEEMGYENLTVNYLRKGLNIKSSSSSYFINITYVDENTLLAKHVVDAVIDAVIEETNVTNAFPVLTDKIRRTSYATEATYNSPNKVLFSMIGLFVGLFVSTGLIITKELVSNQFKSKEEIEKTFNIQILGVIPTIEHKEITNEKK